MNANSPEVDHANEPDTAVDPEQVKTGAPRRDLSERKNPGRSVIAALLLASSQPQSLEAAIYTVLTAADSGSGSLRQAMLDANLTSEPDLIEFAIPGVGPHRIVLLSQLPPVSGTLTIDGYSQAGASANTLNTTEGGSNAVLKIEVVGSGNIAGLVLENANGVNLTVQGLNLHGFFNCLAGAPAVGTSQLRSFGNFLCTNIQGNAQAAGATSGNGIATRSTPSFIGGDLPSQRNVISGCDGAGIAIAGDAQVRGNLIGTDRTGTQAIGNGFSTNLPGVQISDPSATVVIGGTTPTARNLISGNRTYGIGVVKFLSNTGYYQNVQIFGNYIGSDWSGTLPVPNGYTNPNQARFGGGIELSTAVLDEPTPLVIGGFLPGQGNLIAFNHGSGIATRDDRVGEAFDSQGNSVHSHQFGGATNIDLGAFGRSDNDPGDADGGTNGGQNFPQIISATQVGNIATVRYRVDSLAGNASYPLRVDFYRGRDGGSDIRLAQDNYPQSSSGLVREFSFTLPADSFATPITATASASGPNGAGYTSELAPVYDLLFGDGFE